MSPKTRLILVNYYITQPTSVSAATADRERQRDRQREGESEIPLMRRWLRKLSQSRRQYTVLRLLFQICLCVLHRLFHISMNVLMQPLSCLYWKHRDTKPASSFFNQTGNIRQLTPTKDQKPGIEPKLWKNAQKMRTLTRLQRIFILVSFTFHTVSTFILRVAQMTRTVRRPLRNNQQSHWQLNFLASLGSMRNQMLWCSFNTLIQQPDVFQ